MYRTLGYKQITHNDSYGILFYYLTALYNINIFPLAAIRSRSAKASKLIHLCHISVTQFISTYTNVKQCYISSSSLHFVVCRLYSLAVSCSPISAYKQSNNSINFKFYTKSLGDSSIFHPVGSCRPPFHLHVPLPMGAVARWSL